MDSLRNILTFAGRCHLDRLTLTAAVVVSEGDEEMTGLRYVVTATDGTDTSEVVIDQYGDGCLLSERSNNRRRHLLQMAVDIVEHLAATTLHWSSGVAVEKRVTSAMHIYGLHIPDNFIVVGERVHREPFSER